MLPIWIIDLGGSAASKEKLQNLLDSTGTSLRPYWHYCHLDNDPIADVNSCKALVEQIVEDGKKCYNDFIQSGYHIGNFQIVILGAADEDSSQSIFAPLPGLIRDNLTKIVSGHANLGVEITGILFIPHTINQLESADKRIKAAMLLEDLNMLNEQLGSRHYNHLVAYQDIQYHSERFYPGLNADQRTEFLYQILVHLFFTSADKEKIFDKLSNESGMFSLGVASVYYNSEQHQGYELKRLLDKLAATFKQIDITDEEYADKIVHEVLEEDSINPDAISARLREDCGSLNVDLKKMDEEANPHPVWDLFCVNLFPSYYRKFLKYMPARLMKFIQSVSYILLSRFSGIIHRNREITAGNIKVLLSGFYKKVFLDKAAKFATIAQLESVFSLAKDFLMKKKTEVEYLTLEIIPVPKYLRHDYNMCVENEEDNQPSKIMEKLKKNLKKEPVVLSLLVRCFLLGILLVFTIIPVLRVISPKVINLGEIATIEWLWIPVIFLLPLIIEFMIKLRRHFKRIRRLKYRLLAFTILSVNKRLSKYLMDELLAFYDDLTHECDLNLKLLADFRKKIIVPESKAGAGTIPPTMFNQPLIGGSFCGQKLIENEEFTEAEIRVKDETLRLSLLEQEELLALLKSSFKQPETLEAADLSDKKPAIEHASVFISVLGSMFGPQLQIHSAGNIGQMMNILGKNVTVAPLVKMAGVNGMLFSVQSENKPVLKMTDIPRVFNEVISLDDEATKDYAFYTRWQKLSKGIQSQLVCNCKLNPLPPLSLADRLSLYYGFYRQKDLAFTLAGIPISIPKTEMDKLHKEIGG